MLRNASAGQWSVLALTALAQAVIVGIQSFSFAFWVAPWLDEFKAPRGELMLPITASILMGAALSPFAGAALDRWPSRYLFCLGATAFAGGLWLVSLAPNPWFIVLVYGGLIPLGTTFTGSMASQVLVARAFDENRGMALGLSALGVSAGAFVVPPAVTALLAAFGWRGAFQWLAIATLLLIVPPAWLILRGVDAGAKSGGPTRSASPLTTVDLLRNRDFWIIALAFCAMLAPYTPVMYNLGASARDRGISQQTAALIASIGAVALGLGKLTFGKLADRVQARGLYCLAMIVMALGVIVASFAATLPSLAAGFGLITFAGGSFLPLTGKIVGDRFGAAFGRAMGLATFFTVGASALAPVLVGALRDATGAYTIAFLAMLAIVPPALIATRWLSADEAAPRRPSFA